MTAFPGAATQDDDAQLSLWAAYKREYHATRAFFAPHPSEPHWSVQFGRSAWGGHPWVFAGVRVAAAIYVLAGLINALVYTEDNLHRETYFPIYLTHWTYSGETLYFILAAVVAVLHALGKYEGTDADADAHAPPLVKITWGVRSVIFPSAFVVSVIYWGLLYKGDGVPLNDFWLHAENSMFVLLDLILGGYSYRLIHGMHALLYLAVYVIFSVVHYAADVGDGQGHRYIYKPLEWSNARWPTALLTCFECIVLLFVVSNLQWAVVRARNAVAGRRAKEQDECQPLVVEDGPC